MFGQAVSKYMIRNNKNRKKCKILNWDVTRNHNPFTGNTLPTGE